jgi:hypothetical protein
MQFSRGVVRFGSVFMRFGCVNMRGLGHVLISLLDDRNCTTAPRGTKSGENPNGLNRSIAVLALEALGAQNIPGALHSAEAAWVLEAGFRKSI